MTPSVTRAGTACDEDDDQNDDDEGDHNDDEWETWNIPQA